MSAIRRPTLSALLVAVAALGVAACSEAPVGPDQASMSSRSASWSVPEPSVWDRTVWVCKVGMNATFGVSVDGGAATPASVADGECKALYTQPAGVDENHMVRVTETGLDGTGVLDSIKVEETRYGVILNTTILTGVNSAEVLVTWTKGAILTFYNTPTTPPPPPPGFQGCTPGYWRQAHHYDSWVGYSPNQLFSSVFEDAFPGLTLGQVVALGGGGLNALGRHTVAALLNASSGDVDYGYATPAEVIAAFNAVFPGGDYETLKNEFDLLNNAGCPLN